MTKEDIKYLITTWEPVDNCSCIGCTGARNLVALLRRLLDDVNIRVISDNVEILEGNEPYVAQKAIIEYRKLLLKED